MINPAKLLPSGIGFLPAALVHSAFFHAVVIVTLAIVALVGLALFIREE